MAEPYKLSCQIRILLNFWSKLCGMTANLYQSVKLGPADQHLFCVLARQTILVYLWPGPVASLALKMTAELCEDTYPKAADEICKSKYVDDLMSGHIDVEHCENLETGLNAVANYGSFSSKPAIKSGDDAEPTKVLGVLWLPHEDTLKVNCTINVLPDILTRRIIWRAVIGPYDPYGLISAIIIQLKLVMKEF